MQGLDNAVVVVTGAGRGIGRAIAAGYAADGAHVVLSARSTDELERVAGEIAAAGGSASVHEADVTDHDAVVRLMAAVVGERGRLDMVVANAGSGERGRPAVDWSVEQVRRLVELNYVAVWSCVAAAAPYLRAAGGGKILVTGSGTGHSVTPGLGPYGASKAAVASLVQTLATELRPVPIAVNELVPGPVRTALTGYGRGGGDAELDALLGGTGEWVKDPDDVVGLARLIAGFPDDGPTGQMFSLTGRVL
jgi:3-oxoacyl-[acyl-carrier protein] reductase